MSATKMLKSKNLNTLQFSAAPCACVRARAVSRVGRSPRPTDWPGPTRGREDQQQTLTKGLVPPPLLRARTIRSNRFCEAVYTDPRKKGGIAMMAAPRRGGNGGGFGLRLLGQSERPTKTRAYSQRAIAQVQHLKAFKSEY